MKKLLTAILMLIAIALFANPVFAGDEEEDPCDVLGAALCELCGEEVCNELKEMDKPEAAECLEGLEALGELAEAAEKLPEAEQEAVGKAFCEGLGEDDEDGEE